MSTPERRKGERRMADQQTEERLLRAFRRIVELEDKIGAMVAGAIILSIILVMLWYYQ